MTGRPPAELLAEERPRLHRLPDAPLTSALGAARRVDATALVAFEFGRYSVPHELAGQTVWVRWHGEQVVIVHVGEAGPVEVARQLIRGVLTSAMKLEATRLGIKGPERGALCPGSVTSLLRVVVLNSRTRRVSPRPETAEAKRDGTQPRAAGGPEQLREVGPFLAVHRQVAPSGV